MITGKDWAINEKKESACRHKALFDLGIKLYGTSGVLDSQEALENHLHIDVNNDLQVKKSLDFTYDEYKAALADAEKEYDSLQYYRDRRPQYPNTQDILVALAEKEEGDSTMWDEITAKRKKVKEDYPKPK